MSTFCGLIEEIPGISIDRFDGDNLQSKVFFLSHCHTDHMQGLYADRDLPGPLYLSNVSEVLVRKSYPNITNIISLNINEPPTLIKLKCDESSEEKRITVTFIPAIHCPGSVMFLFEVDNIKVLYTGDFRFQLKHVKKLAALKDYTGNPISLDALYVDSTFFDKSFMDFPTQFESNKIICDLIDEWVRKGPEYVIIIRASARYGSECLFRDIYKRTRLKIHVNNSELERYLYFPELDECFTTNENSQIHGCYSHANRNSKYLTCQPNKDDKYVRVIKPSAFIWKNWKLSEPIYRYDSDMKWCRVCYSNHSSFNEIRDFIMYLKPKRVKLNVEPNTYDKLCEYQKNLQDIMDTFASANEDKIVGGSLNADYCEPIQFKNIQYKQSIMRKSINARTIAMEDGDIVPDVSLEPNTIRKRRKF